MRPAALTSVFVLFACMYFISCTKEKGAGAVQQPPVSITDMQQCYTDTNPDSIALRNALLGSWQWEFIKCFWNSEDGNGDDYKGLTIEFKTDGVLEISGGGQQAQSVAWSIDELGDGYFALSLTPGVPQLYGRIIWCGDRVVFADSYIDGCDNYFKK